MGNFFSPQVNLAKASSITIGIRFFLYDNSLNASLCARHILHFFLHCPLCMCLCNQPSADAIQDRIPTVDVNNSRKFVTPQRDLLTDHLFTEFKEMSEEFQDWKGCDKLSALLQHRTETGFDSG